MKITFVMDGGDNLSGGHRTVAVLARGLVDMGHCVHAAARPQRPITLRDRARWILKGKGSIGDPLRKPSHFAEAGLSLQVLKEWRPIEDRDLPDGDVVVATWWETAEWVQQLSRAKGTKVHFIQGYEVWGGDAERVNCSYRLPIPKFVTSQWLAEIIRSQFRQNPVAVVPCGVDIRTFDAPPRGKQAIPTVGLTYSADYVKGCDVSIAAVRLARRTMPELRLVACGNRRLSGDLRVPGLSRYEAWASDQDLRTLYSQCDAWLSASRQEGFGLPILEAMACRTPAIGAPAGAAPELLRNGAGILVKPEDPGDMAGAILRVCSLSCGEWRAISDQAHQTARGYSWDKSVQAFEAGLQACVFL